MSDIREALRASEQGTIISLEVTPGSRNDIFPAGFNPWRKAIGCSVTALPLEGKANRAVAGLVAAALGIARSRVSVISGATSHQKKVLVTGMDPVTIADILEKAV
jgi:uncharacterized protein (TIGR00251 family)